MMRAAVLLVALSSPVPAAEPFTITGRVVGVSDGDTLKILTSDKTEHRVRLYGIDAPEKKQPFSAKSKQRLSELTYGKSVRVEVCDPDRYGRLVGIVFANGANVNQQIVRDGFAWRFTRYDRRGEFNAAEQEARENRRGLWADKSPQPPWEFRKQQREASKAAKERR